MFENTHRLDLLLAAGKCSRVSGRSNDEDFALLLLLNICEPQPDRRRRRLHSAESVILCDGASASAEDLFLTEPDSR